MRLAVGARFKQFFAYAAWNFLFLFHTYLHKRAQANEDSPTPAVWLVKDDKIPEGIFAGTKIGLGDEFKSLRGRLGSALDLEGSAEIRSRNQKLSMEEMITGILACHINEDLQRLAVLVCVVCNLLSGHFGVVEQNHFRSVRHVAGKECDLLCGGIVREFICRGCGAGLCELFAAGNVGFIFVAQVDGSDLVAGRADCGFRGDGFV